MDADGLLVVGEQRLEYARIAAARPGPTLVLLHEGLGCLALWKQFPHLLAAATGLGVFCYSRAGYGGSSPCELPRPLDFHTREARDVLPLVFAAANIDECVLIGHSDGASIALIYAGAAGDPRVLALAALAPHVLTEDKCVDNIRQARDAYADGPLREQLRRYHGANVDCAFRGWSGTWLDPAFAAWDIQSYLAAIRVPVLALRGHDDPYNTAVHVQHIRAAVPAAVEMIEVPDCGHAPHVEQPATVLRHIGKLLRQVA